MSVKIPDKTCEGCGCSFSRKAGERPSEFLQKKYCSAECFRKHNWTTKQQKLVLPSKVCVICKREFNRREGQEANDYKVQKYCSQKCYNKVLYENLRNVERKIPPKKIYPPKICPCCGKEFFQKETDKPNQFKRRKYCSHQCGHKYFWGPKWSEKEEDILRKEYPHIGKGGVAKILPRRTPMAIKTRAELLGINLTPEAKHKINSEARTNWKAYEDEILRKYYPIAGSENITLALPHRSTRSVKDRAWFLGIKMTPQGIGERRKDEGNMAFARHKKGDYVPTIEEIKLRASLIKEQKIRNRIFPDGGKLDIKDMVFPPETQDIEEA